MDPGPLGRSTPSSERSSDRQRFLGKDPELDTQSGGGPFDALVLPVAASGIHHVSAVRLGNGTRHVRADCDPELLLSWLPASVADAPDSKSGDAGAVGALRYKPLQSRGLFDTHALVRPHAQGLRVIAY